MKKFYIALMFISLLALGACTEGKTPAQSIVTASDAVYLNVDSTLTLTVTVLPSDTTDKSLEWSIVDDTVAEVSEDGELTGKQIGETTLTVRVKSTPEVSKTLRVFVVNKFWPNDEIADFAGFELPSFPDFTSVIVEKTDDYIALLIKGTQDDEAAIIAYRDTLLSLGWEVEGTFDTHVGKLTHDSYEFYISMHNEIAHHGDTIEFKIVKDGHDDGGHGHEDDHDDDDDDH